MKAFALPLPRSKKNACASVLFVGIAYFIMAAQAEPDPRRFVVEEHAYEGDQQRQDQSHLYRELVRQTVVLAALHHVGRRPHDLAVDGYSVKTKDLPRVKVSTRYAKNEFHFRVSWMDGNGSAWAGRFPVPTQKPDNIVAIAQHMASEIHAGAADWLRARLGQGDWQPAGEELTEAELDSIRGRADPVSLFERARQAHLRAAKSGASPAALLELAQTYSVWGEVTRSWWTPLPTAMTARALLYTEWLAQSAPESKEVRKARAWVYMMSAYPSAAMPALANILKQEDAPAWAPVLNEALHYKTQALIDRSQSDDSPEAELAALLAVTQVDFIDSENYTGKVLDQVAGRLPYNLRANFTAARQFGVSGQQHYTSEGQEKWWQTLTVRTPKVFNLPDRFRTLLTASGKVWIPWRPEFAPPPDLRPDREKNPERFRRFALVTDQTPDAAYPAWDALGRLLWDGHFVATTDRLHFMAVWWSVPTSEKIAEWLPSFEGHPLQAVIASYDSSGSRYDKVDRFAPVRLGIVTIPMDRYIDRWAYRTDRGARFADRSVKQARDEVFWWCDNDVVTRMFIQKSSAGSRRAAQAEELLHLNPYNPSGLADLIRYKKGGPGSSQRKQARQDDHPLVQWATGEQLQKANQAERAIPLLEKAAAVLGEKDIFKQLAESYLDAGDEARWLQTRLAIEQQPGVGLEHARNRQEIAQYFLSQRRPEEALVHARAAAESYSEWGLGTLAFTLAVLQRNEEAGEVVAQMIKRYGNNTASLLRWSMLLGDQPREWQAAVAVNEGKAATRACAYDLLGEAQAARAAYLSAYEDEGDNYYLLLAGLVSLERGEKDIALACFERMGKEYSGNKLKDWSRRFNRDIGAEFTRQIREGFSVDALRVTAARLRPVFGTREDRSNYRGDIAYFLARFALACGERQAGISWLRQAALPAEGRYITPLVAKALDTQGESFLGLFRTPPEPLSQE